MAQATPLIPLSVPIIKGNAWEYVKDCLDSGWVSSVGSYVGRFETAMAAYVKRRHAVAWFALTDDAAEGQLAFREKRKPVWAGR